MQRRFEAFDRLAERLKAEPECLMMNGHDETGARSTSDLNRLFRRAMRMDPRIVSANGHDRQVNRSMRAQFSKTICKSSITGKKNAAIVSFQQITVIAAVKVAPPPRPRTPVFYRYSEDVDLPRRRLR